MKTVNVASVERVNNLIEPLFYEYVNDYHSSS